jgi:glycosyltransferase involved in cell wall biosynthesis
MSKKLAIIGSVGVPAKYGGFETLAEFLSLHLGKVFKTTIYCSGKAYKKEKVKSYNKCKLVYIPLEANGMQSIPYDVLSIIHAFFTCNILLVLGVAGSFMFPLVRLFSRKRIIVNIDGLEHKREKWSKAARCYLRWAEKMAVRYAHTVVADNKGIQKYVLETYGKKAIVIPYGGDHIQISPLKDKTKRSYGLPDSYAFKVCRIEPENNIHIILEAFKDSSLNVVIIGNWNYSAYGQNLYAKYRVLSNFYLLHPIYDQHILDEIRGQCSIYVHGHSAGGTNPSLVEAMYLGKPILAFDVNYNRFTTQGYASFFSTSKQLKALLKSDFSDKRITENADAAKIYAEEHYNWASIAKAYQKALTVHGKDKENAN